MTAKELAHRLHTETDTTASDRVRRIEAFGQWLHGHRTQLDQTQEAFASTVGLTQSAISTMERGHRISATVYTTIFRALHVSHYFWDRAADGAPLFRATYTFGDLTTTRASQGAADTVPSGLSRAKEARPKPPARPLLKELTDLFVTLSDEEQQQIVAYVGRVANRRQSAL